MWPVYKFTCGTQYDWKIPRQRSFSVMPLLNRSGVWQRGKVCWVCVCVCVCGWVWVGYCVKCFCWRQSALRFLFLPYHKVSSIQKGTIYTWKRALVWGNTIKYEGPTTNEDLVFAGWYLIPQSSDHQLYSCGQFYSGFTVSVYHFLTHSQPVYTSIHSPHNVVLYFHRVRTDYVYTYILTARLPFMYACTNYSEWYIVYTC